MENEHIYQSQFIWKQTTHDGLLPITNFTEGLREEESKRKGGSKSQNKELGAITTFEDNNQKDVASVKNVYGYHLPTQKYILLRQLQEDNTYLAYKDPTFASLVTPQKENTMPIKVQDVCFEVEVKVRVVISEENRFTLTLQQNSNAKIKNIAEDIADLTQQQKYGLTFFYKGQKLSFGERLGDKQLGFPPQLSQKKEEEYLLCLKGGNEGPKAWKRFLHVDDPCRQLTYISDDEAFDAISFIPKRDILWAGFSVYHVANTDIDFKCLYKYKVGGDRTVESEIELQQSQVKDGMSDIMFDNEIPVKAGKPITIMVRFLAGDEFFCSTLLGYGGENYMKVDNEEQDMFEIKETSECTKGETDSKFGNIPRVFYFKA